SVVWGEAAVGGWGAAMHMLNAGSASWSPPVVTYSALTGDGVVELWASVLDHRDRMTKTGELDARRREQQVKWMWAMLEDRVFARLKSDPALKAKLPR